jgi:histidinol-phosphate phosphatase family protein
VLILSIIIFKELLMQRAIFLDRDGVICENRSDYVKNWEEFKFLPGAIESLITLSQLDLPIIVVTNQSAVSRGLVSAETVEDIHRRMVVEIVSYGGRIDRVYYCPHQPKDHCNCRKPKTGMLTQAAQEMGIDLASSYMVGDAATDILAGQSVGSQTYLVLTGRGQQQLVPAFRAGKAPFSITRDLSGAAHRILIAELQLSHSVELWQLYKKHHQHTLSMIAR